MNIYCYPSGHKRIATLVGAPSLAAAKRLHPEARIASPNDLRGFLCAALSIPRINVAAQFTGTFMEPENFGLARRETYRRFISAKDRE